MADIPALGFERVYESPTAGDGFDATHVTAAALDVLGGSGFGVPDLAGGAERPALKDSAENDAGTEAGGRFDHE
jgi:hypothetical protein